MRHRYPRAQIRSVDAFNYCRITPTLLSSKVNIPESFTGHFVARTWLPRKGRPSSVSDSYLGRTQSSLHTPELKQVEWRSVRYCLPKNLWRQLAEEGGEGGLGKTEIPKISSNVSPSFFSQRRNESCDRLPQDIRIAGLWIEEANCREAKANGGNNFETGIELRVKSVFSLTFIHRVKERILRE